MILSVIWVDGEEGAITLDGTTVCELVVERSLQGVSVDFIDPGIYGFGKVSREFAIPGNELDFAILAMFLQLRQVR